HPRRAPCRPHGRTRHLRQGAGSLVIDTPAALAAHGCPRGHRIARVLGCHPARLLSRFPGQYMHAVDLDDAEALRTRLVLLLAGSHRVDALLVPLPVLLGVGRGGLLGPLAILDRPTLRRARVGSHAPQVLELVDRFAEPQPTRKPLGRLAYVVRVVAGREMPALIEVEPAVLASAARQPPARELDPPHA